MKKLLILVTLFVAIAGNAQTTEEKNFEKVFYSIDSAYTENKLDSLKVIMEDFKKSKNITVSVNAESAIRKIRNQKLQLFPSKTEEILTEQKTDIIKKYGKENGENIFSKKLRIGMSWEMMFDAMQDCERISKSETKTNKGSVDIYNYKCYSERYYTFKLLKNKIYSITEN